MADPNNPNPMDLYAAVTQGMPTDAEHQQALAAQLRNQNLLGNIGLASGDRVMGPEGRSLIEQSQAGIGDIRGQQEMVLRQKEAEENRKFREQMLMQGKAADFNRAEMQAAQRYDLGTDQIASRERIAQWRKQAMAGNLGPEELQFLGRYEDITGKAFPGARLMQGPIINQMLHDYGMRDQQGNLTNMDDLVRGAANNRLQFMFEGKRMMGVAGMTPRIEFGAKEIDRYADLVREDLQAVKNSPLKIWNAVGNWTNAQLNAPEIHKLNTDLQALHRAYNMIGSRVGSSMYERLEQNDVVNNQNDLRSFDAIAGRMKKESTIATDILGQEGQSHGLGALPPTPQPKSNFPNTLKPQSATQAPSPGDHGAGAAGPAPAQGKKKYPNGLDDLFKK